MSLQPGVSIKAKPSGMRKLDRTWATRNLRLDFFRETCATKSALSVKVSIVPSASFAYEVNKSESDVSRMVHANVSGLMPVGNTFSPII